MLLYPDKNSKMKSQNYEKFKHLMFIKRLM